ncbi:hypothetical protein QZH41_020504 [Actinostola sp. cb2023]|nr:hypothetical protein QZH41_020504 [Actinostola sp. cb2023]
MKVYIVVTWLAVLQIHASNAFILEGCLRPLVFTKLQHRKEMNSEEFQVNTVPYRASNWKACFLSCCNIPICRQVVYGKHRCIHVRCTGLRGFCKYRPDKLEGNRIHGIIIRYETLAVISKQRETGAFNVLVLFYESKQDWYQQKAIILFSFSSTGQTLSEQLDQLQFRNGPSLVTSNMRFTHAQQCAQYVELQNVTGVATSWATERFSAFPYLYRDNGKVPPLGMRSAVPLGGLGTGSFELRADGTFSEWTLENQSPGGSAKLSRGALDLAFLAVRVQNHHGTKASLLRTHPPRGLPGVDGLSYSGGYPVSKLGIEDKGFFGVKMELFAYGTLKARSATDSALPTVVFSLRVRNPTPYQTNVSLLLNLPLGEQPGEYWSSHKPSTVDGGSYLWAPDSSYFLPSFNTLNTSDTSRVGHDFKTIHGVTSSILCAKLCRYVLRCLAWSVENNACKLKDEMPLHAYKRGVTSGVKSWWEINFGRLTCKRPGEFPNSGNTTIMWVPNDYGNHDNDKNNGNHDYNERHKRNYDVIQEQNGGHFDYYQYAPNNNNNNYYYYSKGTTNIKRVTKNNTKFSYQKQRSIHHSRTNKRKRLTFTSAVSDDVNLIWKSFLKDGHLKNIVVKDTGFHGSGVGRISLGPGEEGTISLVMSWYYPYRDHAGEYVGQYYRNIFKSSDDVAFHTKQNLPKILDELLSWRENMTPSNASAQEVFHVDSSLPDWLQDMLVNSLSYWRTGFWVADGRWRQWETFDCNDVDSVHNDFQRELPYIIFFPGLLENVVRAWAKSQHESGLILEALQGQYGCWSKTNKLDAVGGRNNMADVHPAFIAQVYHLYIWAGKEKLLRDLWPAVRKAAIWMIQEDTDGTGLPLRMTNTYDILQLQKYDHSFYNSVMYLLGLRATEELAGVQRDADLYLLAREAIVKATTMIRQLFWDEERGYYRAWWDHKKGSPPWLMADSLYGQVWAYTLGLGNLLDTENMKSHLDKEALLNDTPYGLQVMTKNDNPSDKRRVTKRDTTSQQTTYQEFNDYFTNLKNYMFNKQRYNNPNTERYGWQPYSDNSRKPFDFERLGRAQGLVAERDWDEELNEASDEGTPYMESNVGVLKEAQRPLYQDQHFQYNVPSGYENSLLNLDGFSDTVTRNGIPVDIQYNVNTHAQKEPHLFTNDRKAENLKDLKMPLTSSTYYRNEKTSRLKIPKGRSKLLNRNMPSTKCLLLRKKAMYRSIWMGASPDWTTLQIHLGLDPDKALQQARKSLNHYRNQLNDTWNIHGLTAGSGYGLDGQPWCTSHYTFHMVLWHIPLALSGQQYSIIERRLIFSPKLRVPYSLPFFVSYASGTIEAIVKYGMVSFKLTVTHGYLVLKTLSISGVTWPGEALKLEKGESVTWP